MALIHHVVTGMGEPAIVFVHGFGCAHSDWDAQVAHFSPRHRTVTMDLRGHGMSPGDAAECSVERYGADVAEVMRALGLPPAVLIGHSMGCRVAVEAALQSPELTCGVVLVDGSQFSPVMEPVMREQFAVPGGYESFTDATFKDMFTAGSDPGDAASVIARARALPRSIGMKMMTDMLRYDVGRLTASLACLRAPVLAVQSTYSNERRERRTMREGQSTPYLEMVRARVPAARVEIVADTGHFPQIDATERTNALIGDFLASLAPR